MLQRTIAEKVSCTGIGLHGGAPVDLTLHPAHSDAGVVFVRCDGAEPIEIPAWPGSVVSVDHATTLGRGHTSVGTVEHLMAALYGLGIDNVRVELNGPEVPIMDGSAASFVYLIQSAGVFEQQAPRRVLRVDRPIEIVDGAKRIRVEPARSLRISYGVDFDHPAIGCQRLDDFELTSQSFVADVSRARTFGFLHEVEALWRKGLGQGGSLENTVVLNDTDVMNAHGLRWPDEFVRHKILDLIGDLALLGAPIEGHIQVERGGHALHHRLVAALLASPSQRRIEARPELGRDPRRPFSRRAELRASA